MAHIAVIGAGIVGSASAIWLLSEGHEVTIYDADPKGLPTSSGNAALIALPEIAPLASPGIITAVPGWMLDPLGPLTIRWPDLPALTPWLRAFLRAATPAREAASRNALTYLMRSALQDHEELGRKAGLTRHLRHTGYISVHDSDRTLAGALDEAARVKAALGYDFERLSPEAARKMVPQLEGKFAGAVHQPVYRMVSNPLTLLRQFQDYLAARGALRESKIWSVEQGSDGVLVRSQGGEATRFDKVVISAGIWSRDFVRGLGLKVLLETERGYNTTYTDLGWNLPLPVCFADHGFVATPLVDGLRVGGAVELAKPETPPNYGRSKAMREKMRRYVPSLPEGGKEWMGRRPSTPDSVPVISRHPTDTRIVFAFGHGHLGLTLSAVTARNVAQLMRDGVADPALAPFDIKRFQ